MTQVPRVPQYGVYFQCKLSPNEMPTKCAPGDQTDNYLSMQLLTSNEIRSNTHQTLFALRGRQLQSCLLTHTNLEPVVNRNYVLDLIHRRGPSLEPVVAKTIDNDVSA